MGSSERPTARYWPAAGREFQRILRQGCIESHGGTPQALFSIGVPRLEDVRRLCGVRAEAALVDLILLTAQNLLGPIPPVGVADGGFLLIVAPRCLPSQALEAAARLRIALQGGVFRWWGRHFRLGVSISVRDLPAHPDRATNLVEEMLSSARAADRLGGRGVVACPTSPAEWQALERAGDDHERIATSL